MDKHEFEDRVSRLEEIGKVIEKLPVGIQGEAFQCLKGYISSKVASAVLKDDGAATQSGQDTDESLFARFDHDKPSDNVRLIAASFFQEYGSEPFSVDQINATAAATGITVPDRVDMTLANAMENGKKLFMKVGRGIYKPTVHGEAFLKTTYSVKKGTKKRITDAG